MPSSRTKWTQEQINFLSDVIAAAVLLKTDRPAGAQVSSGGELESTFLVQQAFKGEIPSGKEVVVRHFEEITEPQIGTASSAADPHEGAKYLLYLRIGINDRFEPTSGVGEPSVSIRRSATVSRG